MINRNFANIKSRYGLTEADFRSMMDEQEHRCAICNEKSKALVVDHDHSNGQVRGLLCQACNKMLGMAKDNPAVLRAASLYILQNGGLDSY